MFVKGRNVKLPVNKRIDCLTKIQIDLPDVGYKYTSENKTKLPDHYE